MSGIRRIYVNSYLAYINETNESLRQFRADFPTSIVNPSDVSLVNASLMYYPVYPNFSPRDNKIYMTATSGGTQYVITITIPASYVYDGVASGTTQLLTELNNNANVSSVPSLPSNFNTDIGTWTYNSTLEKLVFTPVGGVSAYQFDSGSNSAYRRIGLAAPQINVALGTATTTASNSPYLARTQCIYIHTDLANDSMTDGNTSYGSGIIAQMNLTSVAYGSIISYNVPFDFGRLQSPRPFQQITFTILDDNFIPMEFDSNANLALALEVSYKDDELNAEGIGAMKLPLNNPFM